MFSAVEAVGVRDGEVGLGIRSCGAETAVAAFFLGRGRRRLEGGCYRRGAPLAMGTRCASLLLRGSTELEDVDGVGGGGDA